MISIRKNQRGTGAVEAVLIVVIVVAIVVVGWYVYKHRSSSKPVVATTSSTAPVSAPLPNGTSNAELQSDLSNITNTSNQSNQDITATNSSLNDQSTMTSVPQ